VLFRNAKKIICGKCSFVLKSNVCLAFRELRAALFRLQPRRCYSLLDDPDRRLKSGPVFAPVIVTIAGVC
jgi:hypothetical protein